MNTENEKVVRDLMREAANCLDDLTPNQTPQNSLARQLAQELRAALQSQVSNTDGWVRVPVEPTKEMHDAWDTAPSSEDTDIEWGGAYRAMLSAAPKAPQQQEQSGEAVQVCPECDIAGCRHIRERATPTATAEGDVK